MNPETRIGPYQLTTKVGAGGRVEMFRARDARLDRNLAIKVLPKDFVSNADRLRRFEQEAKTQAALNHPNVLTIHDTGVHEGAPHLVSDTHLRKTKKCSWIPEREQIHTTLAEPMLEVSRWWIALSRTFQQ